jgi:ubiquinone/menaquinone biosynthesis C-methylase UbiE
VNKKDQQDVTVKLGEVAFRRKLASQQSSGGEVVFPELRAYDEMLMIMRQRAAATREAITYLSSDGLGLSPFIELGAERCQRSLVLENEFDARGIAVDISFDMLRLSAQVARGLGFEKLPLRVCCDANNLPIQDDALSFAFCYATLHHFPDPGPIIEEMARVLGDHGTLFFDEEPVRGAVYRFTRLYQRHGHRLNNLEKALDKLGLLPFISKAGGVECDHGILEEEFDLGTWQKALSPFQQAEVIVNKRLGLRLDGFTPGLSRVIAWLVGGNIRVLCRMDKEQGGSETFKNLREMLKCPNCAPKGSFPLFDAKSKPGLVCRECGSLYPEVDGVLFLMERSLGAQLYPESMP